VVADLDSVGLERDSGKCKTAVISGYDRSTHVPGHERDETSRSRVARGRRRLDDPTVNGGRGEDLDGDVDRASFDRERTVCKVVDAVDGIVVDRSNRASADAREARVPLRVYWLPIAERELVRVDTQVEDRNAAAVRWRLGSIHRHAHDVHVNGSVRNVAKLERLDFAIGRDHSGRDGAVARRRDLLLGGDREHDADRYVHER